jgi:hypothetical protein
MSELFQRHSQEETLRRIEEELNQGSSPAAILKEMLPKTRDEALFWGRRLPVWDEYRATYPAQVIAVARLVSRQAMKAFRLTLRDDGRVVERPAEGRQRRATEPTDSFSLTVAGEEVHVRYTPQYLPNSGTGLFYIVSPHDPARPHPLSDTGYFSRFVPHDAVEACGGPQAYSALLADAVLRDEEQSFIEAFEGPLPVTDERRCRQANRPQAAPGGHAERLIAEKEKPQGMPRQGMLF